jgi:hypothetical protein
MVFLACEMSLGMSLASDIPEMIRLGTLFLAFILEGGPDDGTFSIDDDDALYVFMGLHSVESLFYF